MHIKCAISGISFSCEHFPANLTSGEAAHPIFAIPQKSLFQYARKWANRELTDTDKYLLYLALFHSTELLDWRVSARQTPQTNKIVEQNMESLIHIVSKINLVKHPSFTLSHVAITSETRDFTNSGFWIRNWEDTYKDFLDGYKEQKLHDAIIDRERRIEKLIRDQNKPIDHYARHMADWAEMASEFPTYSVRVNGQPIPINEYWKQIIVACCKEERIFLIPKEHIEKMLDHLEEFLDGGSIAAHTLFKLIRSGLKKQHNYLGLGDLDLSRPIWKELKGHETAQDVNVLAMVMSAPEKKPIASEYPSTIAYLRAKVKWDAKEKYIIDQAAIKEINDKLLNEAETAPIEIDELEADEIIDEADLADNGLNVDNYPGIGEL